MTELTALWIGDLHHAEFSAAASILRSQTRVISFADASQAREYLTADHPAPDLIILAQSYPGQFDADAVKPLRSLAPLARIIALLGTWCEGESRSGNPIPGTIRVYWHQFEVRCLRELQRLRLGRCVSWGLAATATEDERLLLLDSHSPPDSSNHLAGLAAIITSSPEMAGFLSTACRTHGLSTVCFLPGQQFRASGLTVVLWDSPTFLPEHTAELHRLKKTSNNAPIIALLDFPRIEDHTAALQVGATAVLSKPLYLTDLFNLPPFTFKTKNQELKTERTEN